MNPENIKKFELDASEINRNVIAMLPDEIPGATVYYHSLNKRDEVQFIPSSTFIRVFFLCQGSITFIVKDKEFYYDEKAVFVAKPNQTVDILANDKTLMLEIQWELTDIEMMELVDNDTDFPVTAKYTDAVQYRDPFKSEKTISRAIIPQRIIPRFAMGSVETYGDDLIGQHEHPLLDQFFFSFPENDMILLLDDIEYPMAGNTLLHIPLGSNHGVKVMDNQCAHYIWIDFIFGEEGNKYLDEVHKETGTKKEF